MSTGEMPGGPSEEELRAAYEAQLKQVRVEHILLDTVVTLINLGMRRTGLAPGTEEERDPEQVRLAIDSVRAVLPQLEAVAPGEMAQIRAAVSQLQMAFVRIGGAGAPDPAAAGAPTPGGGAAAPSAPPGPGAGAPGGGAPAAAPGAGDPTEGDPGGPGPAQRSGRLWIPGR